MIHGKALPDVVERINKTLKMMLHRTATEKGMDSDMVLATIFLFYIQRGATGMDGVLPHLNWSTEEQKIRIRTTGHHQGDMGGN